MLEATFKQNKYLPKRPFPVLLPPFRNEPLRHQTKPPLLVNFLLKETTGTSHCPLSRQVPNILSRLELRFHHPDWRGVRLLAG